MSSLTHTGKKKGGRRRERGEEEREEEAHSMDKNDMNEELKFTICCPRIKLKSQTMYTF